MIAFIVALIGAVIFWKLVSHGFQLSARATAATERTSAILEAVLPPEQRERVRAIEARWQDERAAADLAYRRRRAVFLWIVIIGGMFLIANGARAQGIYLGRDGRTHAQIIIAPNGAAYPVAPTFCTPGLGPCPVVLGPPFAPPPYPPAPLPPPAYAPVPPLAAAPQVPPPPPLGWVFLPYTSCAEPGCQSVLVSVPGADSLNVRTVPNGPLLLALLNGTPLIPLRQDGPWALVTPACNLVPTGLISFEGMSVGACR